MSKREHRRFTEEQKPEILREAKKFFSFNDEACASISIAVHSVVKSHDRRDITIHRTDNSRVPARPRSLPVAASRIPS